MPKRKAAESSDQQSKKRIKEEPKYYTNKLSSYEQTVQENIRRNNELLLQLNIVQIKSELQKPKVSKVKTVKMKKLPKEELPRRQSLRIRKLQPDGVTPLSDLPAISSYPVLERVEKPRYRGQSPMVLVSEGIEEDSKALLTTLDNLTNKTTKSLSLSQLNENPDCSRYKKLMAKMKIKPHHVTKVVPDRIFSLEFHSTETKTLVFAGDKKGRLGLWDIGSDEETSSLYVYEPHTRPINCMAMETSNKNKLFTCSYDGTIRSADFGKTVFDEVFAVDEHETYFTYMAFGTTSANTLLASTGDGQVYVVDHRTDNSNCPSYQVHDRAIKCLDVQPRNPNIFVTSTNKGTIALWDARKVKGPKSFLNTVSHSRSVSSVFFSPNTGKQLLSTSMNDLVSVYDVDDNANPVVCCMYRHDNFTGRWLSTFHARWDPKTSTCFGVGSMKNPRQLDIYSSEYKAGALTHLQHDNFTTITSRIAFHPTRNLIAGANSSGKVFLWTI